jgi:hypothetical protein
MDRITGYNISWWQCVTFFVNEMSTGKLRNRGEKVKGAGATGAARSDIAGQYTQYFSVYGFYFTHVRTTNAPISLQKFC